MRIAVVGGGLAGLAATLKIAEAGGEVELFSLVPVRRSHSASAQGGINGAMNAQGEGDSPWQHFDDTIYGGDFLANQPPVLAMCEAAPAIIHLFDRMGVMFNRTVEGHLDFRRFGGTHYHRTAFAGATTGQQLLYALDEQVRRYEVAGRVHKYEGWEFLRVVLDGAGTARGIVAQDLTCMEIRAFPADATILATGGLGMVFGRSTNSLISTGAALAAVYRQGAVYANPEMIQVHPTAIPGDDKLRLMSESARGEGGRVWTYREGQPWYFLEEWYPAYGNLVPRDVATRSIFKVVYELGLGVGGEPMVYLDVSHLPAATLERKLEGILDIYRKFVGEDPRRVPMRVFPAVHYSMGGLWVDNEQMTNLPGLFAIGEADYQYHGANRLGANSLLSTVHSGLLAGPAVMRWAGSQARLAAEEADSLWTAAVRAEEEVWEGLLHSDGPENPYRLHRELGELMTAEVTVIRKNERLKLALERLREFQDRWAHLAPLDRGTWANQALPFSRRLKGMLDVAEAITAGALRRDESRGAHYKPEFPDRNDPEFLRTTRARWRPEGPEITYEPVDTSLLPPRPRRYDAES